MFGGVYLRDVLEHVGLPADYAGAGVNHIHFVAVDEVQASIPSDKAMSPAGECMLLWADAREGCGKGADTRPTLCGKLSAQQTLAGDPIIFISLTRACLCARTWCR